MCRGSPASDLGHKNREETDATGRSGQNRGTLSGKEGVQRPLSNFWLSPVAKAFFYQFNFKNEAFQWSYHQWLRFLEKGHACSVGAISSLVMTGNSASEQVL
jgi:hypothetical protein